MNTLFYSLYLDKQYKCKFGDEFWWLFGSHSNNSKKLCLSWGVNILHLWTCSFQSCSKIFHDKPQSWFCWLINQSYPNIYLEHNSGIGQATCPWTNDLPIMNFAWGCLLLKINYFRSIASMLLMPWLPFSSMLCFTNCSVALSTETGWLVCHVINVNVLDWVC